MAELMLGQPLFPGESGIDQLVEIIKVLGTPSREQIRTMNPNYMEHKFPQIKPHPFNKVRTAIVSQSHRPKYADRPFRCSARLPQRPLISFPLCWNTHPHNDCPRSRPWSTPSSMSCGILTHVFRTLVTRTAHLRTSPLCSISHGMVSGDLAGTNHQN